jgi:NAD(P)-dependent dehydrogenase (short-subunit alcohol dehydrogenase family)
MNKDLQNLLLNTLQLMPSEFAGKVVVVTGAGRGIGEQVAYAFAILGARVIVAEISEQGQTVAQNISSEGGNAVCIPCDVASSDSVHHLVESVHQVFGPVDILVNNAIRIAVAPVISMDENTWEDMIQVNLNGTFRVTRAFLPDMLSRGSGTIINMISTEAMPGLSAYIASKQGILGFTQSLALEVGGAGIRVIPFGPGMVDTPGIRGVSGALAPHLGISQDQFLHLSLHAGYDGLMPPEHAGAATVFLAARLAETYHGQEVNGYEILEQAGLLSSQSEASEPEKTQPDPSIVPTSATTRAHIIEQVLTIINETAQEFEKLPVFVRPIARNGFKSKSGASLEQWQRRLSLLMAGPSSPATPDLSMQLEKLISYYRGVPKETARFTKDQAFLSEVMRISNTRIEVIRVLIDLL